MNLAMPALLFALIRNGPAMGQYYYAGMEEGHKYQPDAPAREKPADPRWRVGLVSARARIFLAGVIPQGSS